MLWEKPRGASRVYQVRRRTIIDTIGNTVVIISFSLVVAYTILGGF
jgi:hypothetical protein